MESEQKQKREKHMQKTKQKPTQQKQTSWTGSVACKKDSQQRTERKARKCVFKYTQQKASTNNKQDGENISSTSKTQKTSLQRTSCSAPTTGFRTSLSFGFGDIFSEEAVCFVRGVTIAAGVAIESAFSAFLIFGEEAEAEGVGGADWEGGVSSMATLQMWVRVH